jgi:hypothetical protein
VGTRQLADAGRERADADGECRAVAAQALLFGFEAGAKLFWIGARANRRYGEDLALPDDDERGRVALVGSYDRSARRTDRIGVLAFVRCERGHHHEHASVRADSVALPGRSQRPAGRQLTREQDLEEIASLAVGLGQYRLLELDVRISRLGAEEVDVAHQRRGQRQSCLPRRGALARGLDDRLPQHLQADAKSVDVVLQGKAAAGAPHRGRTHEHDVVHRDAARLEQRAQNGGVEVLHLPAYVPVEVVVATGRIGGNLGEDSGHRVLAEGVEPTEKRCQDARTLGPEVVSLGR